MSNAFSLFRALVIYGICLPLAVLIGYLLTDPLDRVNDGIVGVVLAFLTFPLFMRWHHPLLVLCWNMAAFVPFVAGHPLISLPVCLISFSISALQYTLNKKLKFISVPNLTWPLLALAAVVILTGQMTGGLSFRATGGANYGGKRYVFVLIAILGYFAMSAQRVAPERGPLYIKLYFLSLLTSGIGHLVTLVAPSLYFIFLIFPPDVNAAMSLSNDVLTDAGAGVARLGGLSTAASGGCICLLALYGIRGLFDMRRPWRMVLLFACGVLSLLGGYRSVLILLMLTFGVQFYFEGLMRSRMLPALILCGILGAAMLVPFTDKLPLSMQRSLSFLPVQIDPIAEMDAKGSTEWRLQMWERVLPEVPGHLLLGKGYSINPGDQEVFQGARGVDPFEGSMVAGDYHNGPLSVIITFGLWGTLAFLWFLYAGIKALYQNHAFGDPRFQKANTLLLAYFIAKVIFFFGVFGSFYSDLATFTGLLGLSVCINGGVRIPAPAPVVKQMFSKFKLADATR